MHRTVVVWLVTGGAGYIGSHVVRALRAAGYGVVVLDDLSTGLRSTVPDDVAFYRGTVTDAGLVELLLREWDVTGVMHLAARKSVPASISDPAVYYRQNVEGTLAVAEAMAAAGVEHFVLASSAAVYGAPAAGRVREADATLPLNPYGETKLVCEWIARDFARASGLKAVSLRYFNVAGAAVPELRDRSRAGLMPRVADAVRAGQEPIVFGTDHPTPDGTCVRDYVHVEDLAEAHVLVANALLSGRCGQVYNIGSGTGVSVRQVIEAAGRFDGRPVTVKVAPRREGDPADVVASIDRIRADLGWAPARGLDEMIADELAGPQFGAGRVPSPGEAVPSPSRSQRGRVVIVTASVGAGHNGAAKEWAARLQDAGFVTEIHDLLTLVPGVVAAGMNRAYETMLHRAPWLYGLLYRGCEHRTGAASVCRLLLSVLRGRVAPLVTDDTVAVLSTYPLASQILGQLRRSGRVTVPTATFLTDFSVHRLWVWPGIDIHLALHDLSAAQARKMGAHRVTVTGPLVPDRFRGASAMIDAAGPGVAVTAPPGQDTSTWSPSSGRRRFGLPTHGRLALLVAGSWGVGDVEQTALDVARTGFVTPVIVCGRNEVLRTRLLRAEIGHPLGWISDMPALLGAVDVLVENAGGLSSLEAMAAGIPVVTYRPIPGHGRRNAETLAAAGVSRYVTTAGDLAQALRDLIDGGQGRDQVARARQLFQPDPVAALETLIARRPDIAQLDAAPASVAATAGAGPVPDNPWEDELAARRALRGTAHGAAVRGIARHASTRRVARLGAAAAIITTLITLVGTFGAEFAVAAGLEAVRAGHGRDIYLVVHPTPNTPLPEATISDLEQAHAAVAVDIAFLQQQSTTVQALDRAGVPLLNAAGGPPYHTGMIHGRGAIRAAASGIATSTGHRPELYLSSGDIDAGDLAVAVSVRERVVKPNATLTAAAGAGDIRPGQIVLVECAPTSAASTTPTGWCDLPAILTAVKEQARTDHFDLATVPGLRR